MSFKNNLFEKIEKKTNVNKDTIYSLAEKLQNSKKGDENAINDVIDTLCKITGKSISNETRSKIINKIKNNDVPKGIDKMF